MTRRIPLIARDIKRMYTGFLIAAVILFILCSYLTEFNVMTLIANGDAFWEFITEDFLPPALPRASRIPGIFSSILVTLAPGYVLHHHSCGSGVFCGAVRK